MYREKNSIEDLLTLHTFFLPFQENAINCKKQEEKDKKKILSIKNIMNIAL
jgi:hypothetical protein